MLKGDSLEKCAFLQSKRLYIGTYYAYRLGSNGVFRYGVTLEESEKFMIYYSRYLQMNAGKFKTI